MKVKLVGHNSKEYWQLIELRTEILRKPLGLQFSDDELMTENQQLHFGVFENDKALACMVLEPQANNKIKMRQVCAAKDYQGKKLGALILNHCELYAAEKGFKVIHCNARKTAEAFYLKHAYKSLGTDFMEVGLPHCYMEKQL